MRCGEDFAELLVDFIVDDFFLQIFISAQKHQIKAHKMSELQFDYFITLYADS